VGLKSWKVGNIELGKLNLLKTKKPRIASKLLMYPGRDLNPHVHNRHRILSPACLPISPPGQRYSVYYLKKPTRGFVKSERRDSNSRPRPWQGRALPTELLSLIALQIYTLSYQIIKFLDIFFKNKLKLVCIIEFYSIIFAQTY
jgi:hypothetical protein